MGTKSAMPLTVIARLQAKPGFEDKVKQALLGMAPPSRVESGCLNYDVFQSNEDLVLFYIYENWTGKPALDAHMQTPHFKNFEGTVTALLAAPMEINLLTMSSAPAAPSPS